MNWKRLTKTLLAVCFALMLTACTGSQREPFEMKEITMDELAKKMDDGETFTLLVERDNCPFCQAMNEYMEETKGEHPGITVYRLDTTDYELFREQEGDMTLISTTEQGQAFLARFPYFLYTPAFYKIVDGQPVEAGIGYDESRQAVSLWGVDSTIDWNQSKPIGVWDFLEEEVTDTQSES